MPPDEAQMGLIRPTDLHSGPRRLQECAKSAQGCPRSAQDTLCGAQCDHQSAHGRAQGNPKGARRTPREAKTRPKCVSERSKHEACQCAENVVFSLPEALPEGPDRAKRAPFGRSVRLRMLRDVSGGLWMLPEGFGGCFGASGVVSSGFWWFWMVLAGFDAQLVGK